MRRVLLNKKANRLVTSDLHLTDRVRDEYRWSIFDWLMTVGRRNNCNRLDIIGDITDRKDHHSGKLVNRLIDCFIGLLNIFEKIIINKGNHDFDKDELIPFFKFLSSIPNIEFINEPTAIGDSLFLPHTRNKGFDLDEFDLNKYSYVYLHETLIGAKLHDTYSSEGGYDIKDFEVFKDTVFISGDMHIPQSMGYVHVKHGLGNFIYVGAPYPIKFGDDYKGRVLIIGDGKIKSVDHDSIRKHSWKIDSKGMSKDLKNEGKVGDHVKVEIHLHQSEFQEYYKMRKQVVEFCKKNKLELFSIEMKTIKSKRLRLRRTTNKLVSSGSILHEFCDQRKLSNEQLEIGKELL